MAIKFGVNGCGRIGRSILRAPYIKAAATGPMKGVLSFTDQPLVKVCAWYDHALCATTRQDQTDIGGRAGRLDCGHGMPFELRVSARE